MRLLSQNILENKDGIFFETKVTIYEKSIRVELYLKVTLYLTS